MIEQQSLEKKVIFPAILTVSAGVILFLFWLIYFRQASSTNADFVHYLPALNAFFNSCSAVCIIAGVMAIRKKQPQVHMRLMFTALFFSTLFFISYVIYHNFHGDTKFLGEGFIRAVYFFVLISHILLSIIMIPMILTSFYFALRKTLNRHRKLALWTYPIWLYVSVTGVVIFYMLKIFNG